MGGQHQIELAGPSDLKSVEALFHAFDNSDLTRTWHNVVSRAMASGEANVAAVRDGETLIAIGVMEYTDTEALLPLLVVNPTRQRQGVGNALLVWLETTAFVAGLRLISVELGREDSVSRRFYRAAGYRRQNIDRWTYCKSLDEIRMKAWRHHWAPKR